MGSLPTTTIFATAEDLRPVLAAVESMCDIKFVECGLFEEEQRPAISTLSALPSLSCANFGDANREPTYLVTPADARVNVRPVPQRRGGTKFAIDQMVNPGSIVLRPGGQYLESAVIAGMLGSVRDDPGARILLKAFSSELRREFFPIKGCLVGPVALELLRAGARLTNSISAPREYDLSIDDVGYKE